MGPISDNDQESILSLEKINAQRINTVEKDMKEGFSEIRQQLRDTADAIFSKFDKVVMADRYKPNVGWGGISMALGLMVTLIFSVGAMIQQNVNFQSAFGTERAEFTKKQIEGMRDEQARIRIFKDRVEEEVLGKLMARVNKLEAGVGDRYTGTDAREDKRIFREDIGKLKDDFKAHIKLAATKHP